MWTIVGEERPKNLMFTRVEQTRGARIHPCTVQAIEPADVYVEIYTSLYTLSESDA